MRMYAMEMNATTKQAIYSYIFTTYLFLEYQSLVWNEFTLWLHESHPTSKLLTIVKITEVLIHTQKLKGKFVIKLICIKICCNNDKKEFECDDSSGKLSLTWL